MKLWGHYIISLPFFSQDELHLAQLAEERQEYLSGVSYESRRLLNR